MVNRTNEIIITQKICYQKRRKRRFFEEWTFLQHSIGGRSHNGGGGGEKERKKCPFFCEHPLAPPPDFAEWTSFLPSFLPSFFPSFLPSPASLSETSTQKRERILLFLRPPKKLQRFWGVLFLCRKKKWNKKEGFFLGGGRRRGTTSPRPTVFLLSFDDVTDKQLGRRRRKSRLGKKYIQGG